MKSVYLTKLFTISALAGAATCTFAQSSVTIFGLVDVGVQYGSTSGPKSTSKTSLGSGNYLPSRLGFRGTEDLGGGLSAGFWLESYLSVDTGIAGQGIPAKNQALTIQEEGGFTFNRRSTVSLAGEWGEVRLGRDLTPTLLNLVVFDPFNNVGVGTTLTVLGPATGLGAGSSSVLVPAGTGTRGVVTRASNEINYFLPPNMGGIYGQISQWQGENVHGEGAATQRDGTGRGFRLGFSSGPFDVAGAYATTTYNTTATTGNLRFANLGGSWDLGFAKLMAQATYDRKRSLIPVDGRGALLGALVPIGPGVIRFAWSRYKIDSKVGPDPRSDLFAVGYVHNLSKRTALYATYAHVRNRGGAAQTLGGATFAAGVNNQGASGLDFGIKHSF